ncbi:MAG TPA: Ig-like domain-containing protein, partial [Steroidobacteraceae bacterium]|nr:Ig-like domain-containing protein [Steroidobacteraceae bacterium]
MHSSLIHRFARKTLLSALPISILAACGGSGGDSAPTTPPTPPAPTYTVGGTLSGVTGTIVLSNNGGNDLSLTTNGAFTFTTALTTGAAYAVTLATPPAGQICTLTNASGAIAASNVTNVTIACAPIPPLAFLTSQPQSGSTEHVRSIAPTMTFDRALNAATVTPSLVGFSSTVGAEPVSVSSSGSILTITPDRKLLPKALYSIAVNTALRGSGGEVPAAPTTISFSTRDGIWQPATPLSSTPLPGGSTDQTPQVVFDLAGNAMAVWPQSNGSRRDLVASRYLATTGAANGWSAPQLIENSDAGDAILPDIAVDSAGNVMAVWMQHDGTRYNAWSSRFAVSGSAASWDAPVLIESGTGAVSGVNVAMNASGATVAVFGQTDGVRINLWSSRYSNGAWGTPEVIETNNATDVHDFDVAIDSQSNAIAVWRQHDGTRENIWSNRGSASGWGTAELLETGSGNAFAPEIAMEPTGIAVVMWAQENGSNRETIANRFAANAWSGTRVLDPS